MSYMKNSANYLWSTTCVLGKGATGAVYQGVHRATGEPVAVKTFNHLSHMRPIEVQMREFEVLKKVDHENIVRLLSIEEENDTRHKVLVMELCTGGSLFNILDDPQNSYGLEEEEFLLVLKHLTAGMKHLRDNHVIHRDLKPGNIMRFIAEDGRSIYKLTDFGAARELEDDQQFMSLYGTEEYLHPDMYERAVLRKPAGKSFKATVDLWSIGVTLYHVATGSLPFRPYGGRKNKDTMYYITTKKESGVISGVQHTENGPIEWSRDLPKTCLLSQGLRELVTELLAGILEVDAQKMWSFDRFFDTVTDIVSRKVFYILYVNEGKEITVYMQPDKLLGDLKKNIALQTEVPPSKQLLLFEKCKLENTIAPGSKLSSYPRTTIQNPVLLLHRDNTTVKVHSSMNVVPSRFPTVPIASINLEHDANIAKMCCSMAHSLKRIIEKVVRCYNLFLKTPNSLQHVITESVQKLCCSRDKTLETSDNVDRHLKLLINSFNAFKDCISCWSDNPNYSTEIQKLSDLVNGIEQRHPMVTKKVDFLSDQLKSIEIKILGKKYLQVLWEELEEGCRKLSGCVERGATYVQKIRDSWQSLVRDKVARNLNFNDEQFHTLEKTKIRETSQQLLSLLQDECLDACNKLASKLEQWYSAAQVIIMQTECLDQEASECTDVVKSYSLLLYETEDEYQVALDKLVSLIKFEPPVQSRSEMKNGIDQASLNTIVSSNASEKGSKSGDSTTTTNHKSSRLLKGLNELKDANGEILHLLAENQQLLEQFQSLSSDVKCNLYERSGCFSAEETSS